MHGYNLQRDFDTGGTPAPAEEAVEAEGERVYNKSILCTGVMTLKKIYLAGFDVFAEDAVQRGREMKKLCSEYGFEGLYPLDNECSSAQEIFRANIGLIRSCDIIAANVNEFRGMEPDSGTAFEIGFACALGKSVYCYSHDMRTLREKLGDVDAKGLFVEDFSLPYNLMLSVPSVLVKGDFSACIRKIAEDMGNL